MQHSQLNLTQAQTKIISSLNQVSPNISAETTTILAHILKISTNQLFQLDTHYEFSPAERDQLEKIIRRRLNHEPLERITGHTEFFGLPIVVCQNTLIPRPETEGLVELALKQSKLIHNSPIQILEIGLGTGCVCVAICTNLLKSNVTFDYLGIDISNDAINCTNTNLKALNLETQNLRNQQSSVTIKRQNVFGETTGNKEEFDLIVSNPPYLTAEEMTQLSTSVKDYEPLAALSGGNDGLEFYRRILEIACNQTKKPICCLEIGPAIAKESAELFAEEYQEVEILTDLFGRERYLLSR